MFRAIFVTSLLLLASATSAREGDLDTSFAFNGATRLGYNLGDKFDTALSSCVDARGRYTTIGFDHAGHIETFRSLPDGSLDPSAGGAWTRVLPNDGLRAPILTAATCDASGRIVTTGYMADPFSGSYPFVCRYSADGDSDNAVGLNGCRILSSSGYGEMYAVTTDQIGQIYLAGSRQVSSEDTDFLVAKLSAVDAAPLASFGSQGFITVYFDIDAAHSGGDADAAAAILWNGTSLFVGGHAYNGLQGDDFAIAKLSSLDGSLVTSFCPTAASCADSKVIHGKRTIGYDRGAGNYDRLRRLAMTPYGNLAMAGEVTQLDNALYYTGLAVGLLSPQDGQIMAFPGGVTTIFDHLSSGLSLNGLAFRSDGRVLVGGTTATTPQSADPNRWLWAAQYNADGTADDGFATWQGNPSHAALFAFPKLDASQPTDHFGGSLLLDRGRIVLTGGRLWQQNFNVGVNDYDVVVARMKGDSIFTTGDEF